MPMHEARDAYKPCVSLCMHGAPDAYKSCIWMCNACVAQYLWCADDAAHVLSVGVIALVLVAVCGACANWTAPTPRCTPNIEIRARV